MALEEEIIPNGKSNNDFVVDQRNNMETGKHGNNDDDQLEITTAKEIVFEKNGAQNKNVSIIEESNDRTDVSNLDGDEAKMVSTSKTIVFSKSTNTSMLSVSGKEKRNIFILGLGFLFLFSAYSAMQNLQGSLNDEAGLGVIALGCLYGSGILSCILAPFIVSVLTVKYTIILSLITHILYTMANFHPTFYTLLPSTILVGLLWGPFWTSQGIYMTTCSFSYASRTGIDVYSSLTKFNGIYYTLYNLSNIIGNLVSSTVLYQGTYNETNRHTNASSLDSVCGVTDCPDLEQDDIIADPDELTVYILLGVYLGCVVAALVCCIFLTHIPRERQISCESARESVVSWFSVLITTDMKLLIPLLCYFAVAEELLFAEVTKSYISCPIGIQYVGFVLTAYGVTASITSYVFSYISKYMKRYVTMTLAACIQMSVLVWCYHWSPNDQDTVYIFILACVWGICEGMWKTQNSAMIGDIFAKHIKSVFAVKEGLKSIAFTVTFSYSSVICVYLKLLVTMCLLVVALLMYYLVEYRFVRRTRKEKLEHSQDINMHL